MTGRTWFHGDTKRKDCLRGGGLVTCDPQLAHVLSHAPRTIAEQDGDYLHDGSQSGYLHIVSEDLSSLDLEPFKFPGVPEGMLFHCRRELNLTAVAITQVDPASLLNGDGGGAVS